jgi:peroxidase
MAKGYSQYDPKTNPTILTEFTTAAMRFGHSTIQGTWAKVDSRGNVDSFPLRERFFFPAELIAGRMDQILRGLIWQPSEEFDSNLSDDVRNHL